MNVLFLCVANSARSQLAEGLARSMAPHGTRVQSAGSQPGTIRPEALRVLQEIGIDASAQYAKGIADIDTGSVELIVTLCAEEACPVFLQETVSRRIHYPLPDPATNEPLSEEQRLARFRETRDALTAWLPGLWAAAPSP